MSMDLRTISITPLRQTFGHLARRMGAELRIESEPEEGTRVELHFSLPDRRQLRPVGVT